MKKCLLLVLVFFSLTIFGAQADEDLFHEAGINFDRGEYEVALELYNDLARSYPYSVYFADAQFRRALSLFKLNRVEESLKVFVRVKDRYQTNSYNEFLSFWLGANYYAVKDYKNAKKSFFEYLSTSPKEFVKEALLYKALSEYKLGEYDFAYNDAQTLMDRQIELADEPAALALVLSVLLKKEKYDEVLEINNNLDEKKLDPEYADEINLYRAEAFYKLNKLDEAEILYRVLLASQNNDIASTSVLRLFDLYRKNRDYAALNDLIESSKKMFANKQSVLNSLLIKYGVEKFKLKRYDEAIDSLIKVWNSYENYENMEDIVPLYLAESFYRTSRGDRAQQILFQYAKFAKSQKPLILIRGAFFSAELKHFDECKNLASIYIDQFPEEKDFSMAVYYYFYSEIQEGKGFSVKDRISQYEIKYPNLANDKNLQNLKTFVTDSKEFDNTLVSTKLAIIPSDRSSWINLLKNSYQSKNFKKIILDTNDLFKKRPRLKNDDVELFYYANYMRGLSYISEKDYLNAKKTFDNIDFKLLDKTNIKALVPYFIYYQGWTYYRLIDYKNSIKKFNEYIKDYPDGEFYLKALLYSAWSSYSLKNFKTSAEGFEKYANLSSGDEKNRVLLLAAKSYGQANLENKSTTIYENVIATKSKNYSDKALYEYYTLLRKQNKITASIETLTTLITEYPNSDYSKEGLFLCGELNYSVEKYNEAELYYSKYYNKYPNGENVENAIYFAGLSSYSNKDYRTTIKHFELFLLKYADASFAPNAMEKLGDSYIKVGDISKADIIYNNLALKYPNKSAELNLNRILSKISYMFAGKSEQEADLNILIAENDGIKTANGREAILKLAEINISGNDKNKKIESEFTLKEIVAKYADTDKLAVSKAYYLLGKYYKDNDELLEATDNFFAAVLNAQTQDEYVAESLYNIVDISIKLKKQQDATAALKRLKSNYPKSVWTEKATKLRGVK